MDGKFDPRGQKQKDAPTDATDSVEKEILRRGEKAGKERRRPRAEKLKTRPNNQESSDTVKRV